MSILDIFSKRKAPITSDYNMDIMGRWIAMSGMSDEELMNSATAVACINLIAGSISQMPLHLFFKNPGTGERQKAGYHALYRLFRYEPNPEETAELFINSLVHHLAQYGNGFILRDEDTAGNVQAVYLLNPKFMEVKRDPVTNRKRFFYRPNKDTTEYSTDQVLHIPGLFYDGTVGYSPIKFARAAFELGKKLDEHGLAAFGNGVNSNLNVDISDMYATATPKDVKDIADYIARNYTGRQNVGKPLISFNKMKASKLDVSSNHDSQFIESKDYQSKELAQIFSVPLWKLKGEVSGDIEQGNIIFIQDCLMPYMRRIESYLSKLLTAYERQDGVYYFEHDTSAFLRASTQARYEVYAKGIGNGVLLLNEARQKENLPSLGPVGDIPFLLQTPFPVTQENIDSYMASAKVKAEGLKTGQGTVQNGNEPNLDSKII